MYFFYYIPVGLDIRPEGRSAITKFLAAVCVLVFVLYNHFPVERFFSPVRLVFFPFAPSVAASLTHAFVHTGWTHLLGNMVYLLVFGRALEGRLGPGRFFALFAVSAMGGAYTHLLLTRLFMPSFLGTAVAGASGATSGLLGAFLVRFHYGRVRVAYWLFMPLQGINRAGRSSVPVILAVLFWLLYQGVYAAVQFGTHSLSVAYGVHVGGFLFGALAALIFGGHKRASEEKKIEKARRYFRKADWFSSQAEYINYLNECPGDSEAHAEAARACLCTGDAATAGDHFAESIRIYRKRGQPERAVETFIQAVRNVPLFSMKEAEYLDMAFGAERSLRYAMAAEAYGNFLSLYPLSGERSLVMMRLAGIYSGRFQERERAMALYRKVLTDFPQCPWAEFAKMRLAALKSENCSCAWA